MKIFIFTTGPTPEYWLWSPVICSYKKKYKHKNTNLVEKRAALRTSTTSYVPGSPFVSHTLIMPSSPKKSKKCSGPSPWKKCSPWEYENALSCYKKEKNSHTQIGWVSIATHCEHGVWWLHLWYEIVFLVVFFWFEIVYFLLLFLARNRRCLVCNTLFCIIFKFSQ